MNVIRSLTLGIFLLVILAGFSSAECKLTPSLLNQDPYPAVPGEYVKVVFQLDGTENVDCGKAFLDIVPTYPFSVDSNSTKVVVESSTFLNGYPSYLLVGYHVRVDKDAVDGDNKLTIKYGNPTNPEASYSSQDFNVNVEDTRTDFELILQSYSPATNVLTFSVVNIGKKNAEALTLELPAQANINQIGANKVVIGSLNSNDDTTATITAAPRGEGDILVNLVYNDENGVRRTIEKIISYSKTYEPQVAKSSARSGYFYLFWLVVVAFVLWKVYQYYQRKKAIRAKTNLLLRR